jgi:hypothetical protein
MLLVLGNSVENFRYATRRLTQRHRWPWAPGRAALIVPCKGLDSRLQANLTAAMEQDYGDVEIVFVVQTSDDSACAVIKRLIDRFPRVAAQLVIAGRARGRGQKVHNLLAGLERVSSDVRYLAFLDADARPARDWLRLLLSRLDKAANLGAVTGYRWFVPLHPGIGNWLLYSLNNTIACLSTSRGQSLVWGGSWVIKRETFERIGLATAWQHTLSDDLVATKVMSQDHGLRIKFEPACVVPSPIDMNLSEACSFLRRQLLLLRIFTPRWWLGLVTGTLISTACNWFPLIWLGTSLVAGTEWDWPLALSLSMGFGQVARGLLRTRLGRAYFPEHRQLLQSVMLFDIIAAPLLGPFLLVALLASSIGRRVYWREIRYELDARGDVLSTEHPAPCREAALEPLPAKAVITH